MKNLMDLSTVHGVRENVIWLDRFVTTEELATVFRCTSIYVTPFDECTPTSVST